MMIDHPYIEKLLNESEHLSDAEMDIILDKAERYDSVGPGSRLEHDEIAALLRAKNPSHLKRIFDIADKIKQDIYGNRIVMFAPLYVSDHCVNQCVYCSYNVKTSFARRKLTQEEVRQEVKILEQMGHKRIALEAGEHDGLCSIDYILECIDTIYSMKSEDGEVRRINVNIAAMTTDNYRKLKEAGIGTYILFQETYHKPTYEKMHLSGPKSDYHNHLTAFDRAMEAGVDDVGAGVLFGLYDPYFEVMALMLHNEHLEKKFGVGFHTVSVPRIRPAKGMCLEDFPYLVDDETFEKIVAIIRIAVPYTGIILSTREDHAMHRKLLKSGVSQLSAGSCAEVGGYAKRKEGQSNPQFFVSDTRDAFSMITELLEEGFLPSFCTACYRSGRTGDRFMQLAKSGKIKSVCLPNALMTLCEYAMDYGDAAFREKVFEAIRRNLSQIEDAKVKEYTEKSIQKIVGGERDFFV